MASSYGRRATNGGCGDNSTAPVETCGRRRSGFEAERLARQGRRSPRSSKVGVVRIQPTPAFPGSNPQGGPVSPSDWRFPVLHRYPRISFRTEPNRRSVRLGRAKPRRSTARSSQSRPFTRTAQHHRIARREGFSRAAVIEVDPDSIPHVRVDGGVNPRTSARITRFERVGDRVQLAHEYAAEAGHLVAMAIVRHEVLGFRMLGESD